MNRHDTIRLNTAQALVRYLGAQQVEIEGNLGPMFAGVWAIFGHCNVAGLGEALYGIRDHLQTYRAHNEQTMSHAAIAFAKASPPASNYGVHVFNRARCDEHGHGCGCCARQSVASAVPAIVARGGVHYSEATAGLATFALRHAIPVAETQAGKSALAADHRAISQPHERYNNRYRSCHLDKRGRPLVGRGGARNQYAC